MWRFGLDGWTMDLGKLEPVDVRTAWSDEAHDFTPWLLAHDNLLAESIGIELQLERSEHPVGEFSLDLIGRDLTNDAVLIVENQLEGTDHRHLGQIMTYAGGTDASTIVWIATHFRDEHRQALDWLNEQTREDVRFFGLELSVVRIGDSQLAPLFRMAVEPNQWQKIVRSANRGATAKEHWTRETFLSSISASAEREFARELIDRVEADGHIWYGSRPRGHLSLHYRQSNGPIALAIRDDGHVTVYGLWNWWERVQGHTAYRPVADALGQQVDGSSRGVPVADLDLETLWLAVEESAALLREVDREE